LRTNYFKVIEHGSRLWSAHRGLNTLAFILGLVGMIIILSADEFKEAMGSKERHVIYGFSMIVALFVHILFRVAYPDVSLKTTRNLRMSFVPFIHFLLTDMKIYSLFGCRTKQSGYTGGSSVLSTCGRSS
jgi:hypothetical protein